MKKYLLLILAGFILSSPVLAHVNRPRTDRHNNPTAMIWTSRVEAFFLSRGYRVKMGEPFPDTNRYHTLNMADVADPIKATIVYIDAHGFYAPWGVRRWEHTAMSHNRWLNLNYRKKVSIIQAMYNKENGTVNQKFTLPGTGHAPLKPGHGLKQAEFKAPARLKISQKRKDVQSKVMQPNDKIYLKWLIVRTALIKFIAGAIPDSHGNVKAFTWSLIIACCAIIRKVLILIISKINLAPVSPSQ